MKPDHTNDVDLSESLDRVLEAVEAPRAKPASEVAIVVADEHPVLVGRVRCAFEDGSESWVPCLAHVRPRTGDRVLVLRPQGAGEGIVSGVVDGYRSRVEAEPRAAHVRRVRPDEVVVIESDAGVPLLEVRSGEHGPTIRFLSADATVEANGSLRFEADSIDLVARKGAVAVRAADDVKLTGEQIHLN